MSATPLHDSSVHDSSNDACHITCTCRYRRQLKLWEHGYQTLAADGLVYAFARGDAALVVLSGQAAKLSFDRLPRKLALSDLPAAWRGKTLTNIFDPQVRR